jgi:hypothetical protein
MGLAVLNLTHKLDGEFDMSRSPSAVTIPDRRNKV